MHEQEVTPLVLASMTDADLKVRLIGVVGGALCVLGVGVGALRVWEDSHAGQCFFN
jgi:hypothetical protein